MSKPISFGFGLKPKPTSSTGTKPVTPRPISLPSTSSNVRSTFSPTTSSKSKAAALRDDSEDDDEVPPQHEALTGFSATGAILSKPKADKTERIIENSGNSDWRKRGKNLLPQEVQVARAGGDVVTVEKDEVSKAHGLQFAEKRNGTETTENGDVDVVMQNGHTEPQKEMTEDERALAALLDDGSGKAKGTSTIAVQGNEAWQRNETDDFRADVALRPDSSTLEDYAAMPVEEFGMAMLRGMGRKRRANGQVIEFNKGAEEEKKKKDRTNQGLLGIGAKVAKGIEGVELGAWGKSDMRKNAKGEGFFTPVMIEDKRTGERITEEEFERRKKSAKVLGKEGRVEEDWRDRRDRNLDRNGRDQANGDHSGESRKRDRGERDRDEEPSSRSRRDREQDRDERDYESSRSRRERSRSRDRRRRDDDHEDNRRDKERRRDRRRDKYDDVDHRADRPSHRSEGRYRDDERRSDRDRDRDKDKDRDDRRHRDRR